MATTHFLIDLHSPETLKAKDGKITKELRNYTPKTDLQIIAYPSVINFCN